MMISKVMIYLYIGELRPPKQENTTTSDHLLNAAPKHQQRQISSQSPQHNFLSLSYLQGKSFFSLSHFSLSF